MNEMAEMEGAAAAKTWKAVYTIVERAERKFWVRIGTAFVNHDQSLNVKLDASPTNGQLHIRDFEPYGAREARRGAERSDDPLDVFGPRPGPRGGVS